MPLRRQIRSNSTSADRGLVNRPVNCFPLSDNTCCGQPNSRRACTNAVHTARAVARGTTAAMTQYREWSSTPVTTFTPAHRSGPEPRTSTPTGTAPPTPPSRSSAPKPDGTRTTRRCESSSAS